MFHQEARFDGDKGYSGREYAAAPQPEPIAEQLGRYIPNNKRGVTTDNEFQAKYLKQVVTQGGNTQISGGRVSSDAPSEVMIARQGVNIPGNSVVIPQSLQLTVTIGASDGLTHPIQRGTGNFFVLPWVTAGGQIIHKQPWDTKVPVVLPTVQWKNPLDPSVSVQWSEFGHEQDVYGPYGIGSYYYPSNTIGPSGSPFYCDTTHIPFIPGTIQPSSAQDRGGGTGAVLVNVGATMRVSVNPPLSKNFSLGRLVSQFIKFSSDQQPTNVITTSGNMSAGLLSDWRGADWPGTSVSTQGTKSSVNSVPAMDGIVSVLGDNIRSNLSPVDIVTVSQPNLSDTEYGVYTAVFPPTGVSGNPWGGKYPPNIPGGPSGTLMPQLNGCNEFVGTAPSDMIFISPMYTVTSQFTQLKGTNPNPVKITDIPDVTTWGVNSYPQVPMVETDGTIHIVPQMASVRTYTIPLSVDTAPYKYTVTIKTGFGNDRSHHFGTYAHVWGSANPSRDVDIFTTTGSIGTNGYSGYGANSDPKRSLGSGIPGGCLESYTFDVLVPKNPDPSSPVIGPSYLGTYFTLYGMPNATMQVQIDATAVGIYEDGNLGPADCIRYEQIGANQILQVTGRQQPELIATNKQAQFQSLVGRGNVAIHESTVNLVRTLFTNPDVEMFKYLYVASEYAAALSKLSHIHTLQDWVNYVGHLRGDKHGNVLMLAERALNDWLVSHGHNETAPHDTTEQAMDVAAKVASEVAKNEIQKAGPAISALASDAGADAGANAGANATAQAFGSFGGSCPGAEAAGVFGGSANNLAEASFFGDLWGGVKHVAGDVAKQVAQQALQQAPKIAMNALQKAAMADSFADAWNAKEGKMNPVDKWSVYNKAIYNLHPCLLNSSTLYVNPNDVNLAFREHAPMVDAQNNALGFSFRGNLHEYILLRHETPTATTRALIGIMNKTYETFNTTHVKGVLGNTDEEAFIMRVPKKGGKFGRLEGNPFIESAVMLVGFGSHMDMPDGTTGFTARSAVYPITKSYFSYIMTTAQRMTDMDWMSRENGFLEKAITLEEFDEQLLTLFTNELFLNKDGVSKRGKNIGYLPSTLYPREKYFDQVSAKYKDMLDSGRYPAQTVSDKENAMMRKLGRTIGVTRDFPNTQLNDPDEQRVDNPFAQQLIAKGLRPTSWKQKQTRKVDRAFGFPLNDVPKVPQKKFNIRSHGAPTPGGYYENYLQQMQAAANARAQAQAQAQQQQAPQAQPARPPMKSEAEID